MSEVDVLVAKWEAGALSSDELVDRLAGLDFAPRDTSLDTMEEWDAGLAPQPGTYDDLTKATYGGPLPRDIFHQVADRRWAARHPA